MGWKWVSHPILRFKRTEVEKGIPVNGLFKPWSTRERLRTSFKIRNLEAWLRCGVLCFGLKWQRQASKGKMLLGQVRESEIPHLDLSGASKFPTEHKHLHGSEWNPLSQWMIHKMLQGNSLQSRSGFRDKDKARDFMGSYRWDEVCHHSYPYLHLWKSPNTPKNWYAPSPSWVGPRTHLFCTVCAHMFGDNI